MSIASVIRAGRRILRSRWADILSPLILSLLFFAGLTYLFYNGQRHRRIASHFEEQLLHLSLLAAGPRPYLPPPLPVAVWHIEPHEEPLVVMAKALQQKPQSLYISLQPSEDDNAALYDSYLTFATRAHNAGTAVYWGVPPDWIAKLPKRFYEEANVFEADPCEDWQEPQLLCHYNDRWSRWLMQKLAFTFLHRSFLPLKNDNIISLHTPHLYPSYVLDLSLKSSLPGRESMQPYAIFMGWRPSRSEDLLRTAHEEGLTLHEFWALSAEWLQQKSMVHLAPPLFVMGLLGAIMILMLFLMMTAGLWVGFFGACLLSIAFPLINAFLLRYYQWYIPSFDVLYVTGVTVLLIAFGKLSLESFHDWKLQTKKIYAAETLQSKSNFVALISHNLNTPIAKMLGMLTPFENLTEKLPGVPTKEVLYELSYIHLTVRHTLTRMAMENQEYRGESVRLSAWVQELEMNILPVLRRLNINIRIDFIDDMMVTIDKRWVASYITSLAWLHSRDKPCTITFLENLSLEYMEEQEPALRGEDILSHVSQQLVEQFPQKNCSLSIKIQRLA
jgi:hypothetical protein